VSVTSWLEQFSGSTGPDLSPLELARIHQAREDAAAEKREAREAAERQAAVEEKREALEFANRMGGNPLGELQLHRAAFERADDECRDLEAQLDRARKRRDRAQSNVEFFARRMQDATNLAQRSSPAGLGNLAERVDEERRQAATRARVDAMLASARPGRGGPHPFVSRGEGGEAEPACPECKTVGASADESFLIHADPSPVPVPDEWAPEPYRHGYVSGQVIYR
jgi:hypothetical protein